MTLPNILWVLALWFYLAWGIGICFGHWVKRGRMGQQ